jgi:hypothetical protein
VLFLDQAQGRGDAYAMGIFAAHNVTVVLLPPHLTHVLQPVDLVWVRQFKPFLSAKFHRLTRHQRRLANAFAELGENMETAGEKHRARVGSVSILEAHQAATIGSVTGLGSCAAAWRHGT